MKQAELYRLRVMAQESRTTPGDVLRLIDALDNMTAERDALQKELDDLRLAQEDSWVEDVR